MIFGLRKSIKKEGKAAGEESLMMLLLKASKKVQFRETNRAKSDQDSLETRGSLASQRSQETNLIHVEN